MCPFIVLARLINTCLNVNALSLKLLELQVISRGLILLDEQHLISDPESKESEYSFIVTSEMTPNFLVLASYIRDDDEVVADFISMNADLNFENQVRT